MLNSYSKDNPRRFVAPQVLCFLLPLAEILIQGHQLRKIGREYSSVDKVKAPVCPCYGNKEAAEDDGIQTETGDASPICPTVQIRSQITEETSAALWHR